MSYLGLVKQVEARRAEYRAALQRWWHAADDNEAYQEVLRLFDDLGPVKAQAIRDEESGSVTVTDQPEDGR